ncbi:MAG: type II toxin-antitoxin system RelE/ParE family toxin [bacterium]
MLYILKRCGAEILEFPEEVRSDAADAFARLQEGLRLSMPLSRPMPGIGRGCHELRFRHRSGVYRIIYCLAGSGMIYGLHAFKKKARETPYHNIEIAKRRLKEVADEKENIGF